MIHENPLFYPLLRERRPLESILKMKYPSCCTIDSADFSRFRGDFKALGEALKTNTRSLRRFRFGHSEWHQRYDDAIWKEITQIALEIFVSQEAPSFHPTLQRIAHAKGWATKKKIEQCIQKASSLVREQRSPYFAMCIEASKEPCNHDLLELLLDNCSVLPILAKLGKVSSKRRDSFATQLIACSKRWKIQCHIASLTQLLHEQKDAPENPLLDRASAITRDGQEFTTIARELARMEASDSQALIEETIELSAQIQTDPALCFAFLLELSSKKPQRALYLIAAAPLLRSIETHKEARLLAKNLASIDVEEVMDKVNELCEKAKTIACMIGHYHSLENFQALLALHPEMTLEKFTTAAPLLAYMPSFRAMQVTLSYLDKHNEKSQPAIIERMMALLSEHQYRPHLWCIFEVIAALPLKTDPISFYDGFAPFLFGPQGKAIIRKLLMIPEERGSEILELLYTHCKAFKMPGITLAPLIAFMCKDSNPLTLLTAVTELQQYVHKNLETNELIERLSNIAPKYRNEVAKCTTALVKDYHFKDDCTLLVDGVDLFLQKATKESLADWEWLLKQFDGSEQAHKLLGKISNIPKSHYCSALAFLKSLNEIRINEEDGLKVLDILGNTEKEPEDAIEEIINRALSIAVSTKRPPNPDLLAFTKMQRKFLSNTEFEALLKQTSPFFAFTADFKEVIEVLCVFSYCSDDAIDLCRSKNELTLRSILKTVIMDDSFLQNLLNAINGENLLKAEYTIECLTQYGKWFLSDFPEETQKKIKLSATHRNFEINPLQCLERLKELWNKVKVPYSIFETTLSPPFLKYYGPKAGEALWNTALPDANEENFNSEAALDVLSYLFEKLEVKRLLLKNNSPGNQDSAYTQESWLNNTSISLRTYRSRMITLNRCVQS